ncbi:MAG TPA: hypothetical protein DEA08_06295, partial [Planctomycetes bacterium]|nr:hypothetical protein [Planctomycetota bacterium]
MQTPTWLRSLPAHAAALPGALVAVALVALAFLAPKPAIDNAPAAWFPQRDARIAAYRDFQSTFGADEVLVVSLQGAPLAEVVRQAGALERGLAARPGVAQVLGPERAFSSECSILSDPELGQDGLRFVGWAFRGPLNESLRLLEPSATPPRARVIASLHPAGPAARAELAQWLDEQRSRAAAAG